jgi:hypothetical protein
MCFDIDIDIFGLLELDTWLEIISDTWNIVLLSHMGSEFKSIIFYSNELMSLLAWVHVVDGLLL